MIPDVESPLPQGAAPPRPLARRPRLVTRLFGLRHLPITRFGLVGASGLLVNTVALYFLVEIGQFPHLVAAALAAELSILSNFALNDRWTFRATRPAQPWGHRLWRYNAIAFGGMLLSLLVLTGLSTFTGIHYLLANILAVGIATWCNYSANRRWTWAMPGARASILSSVARWPRRRPATAPAGEHAAAPIRGQRPATVPVAAPVTLRRFAGLSRALPLGQLLLAAHLISRGTLDEALETQRQTGIRLGEMLVCHDHLRAEHLALALAYQRAIEPFDLGRFVPERLLPAARPGSWYLARRVIPLVAPDNTVYAITTEATDTALMSEIARRTGRRVRPVIATPGDLETALHALHRDADLARSSQLLRTQAPQHSAHVVLTRLQRSGALIALGFLAIGALRDWRQVLIGIFGLITVIYLITALHKLYLVMQGWRADPGERLAAEVTALDEQALPMYTILVPLYREAVVLPQLTAAIQALDWPKARLDVRLLLEEDDVETIVAAREAGLPPYFTLVVVPKSEPRGKPRACNYGLIHARGEYVVIYDAEDIPEPDQLRKVYATFLAADDRLACVQCRLNFYNPEQNLLTRWFTSEYSMFFDLLLPGMQRSGVPIPLGGTSNHFHRGVLERLGAWDPYNVTEDADLGIRLHKLGLRTVVIDSTTYEEANPRVGNWIRQRSRWIKGYVHTWLVHMRHPIALWRALGWRGFWGFQFTIGGTGLTLLLNPVYWLLTTLWFGTHWGFIGELFPDPIFYLGGVALYLGNFLFVYVMVAGTLARGHHSLVRTVFLSPLYWALMSVAAWKGVLQLAYAPSYWEKTEHGLATPGRHAVPGYRGGEVA